MKQLAICFWIVLAGLIAMWPLAAFADEGAVTADANDLYNVEIRVGYGEYQAATKADVWYPVWAMIDAKKNYLDGKLVLTQPASPLNIDIPFKVAKGNRQRVLGYYKLNEGLSPRLDVDVVLDDRLIEHFNVPLQMAEEGEQHILAIAEEAGGFSQLNRKGVEFESSSGFNGRQPYPSTGPQSGGNRGGARVIYGVIETLPEDPIALEGLDGIILNTPNVRKLTTRQWEALRNWIAGGGNLLVAGGKNQPFVEQSVLKGAFGLRFSPSQSVAAAEMFTQPGMVRDFLVSWPMGEWTRLALASAKEPNNAKRAIIASKRVGRGWFHLCAAALDKNFLDAIQLNIDPVSFWPGLLERHFTATPLETFTADAEGSVSRMLQTPYLFNLVGPRWVISFLGIYILLVLPINWLVWGRLKRRELAWPTAIVLALGFAGFAYASGLRSQSKVFQSTEATFVIHDAGAATARAVTLSSIFSPRRHRAQLDGPTEVFVNQASVRMNNPFYQPQPSPETGLNLTVAYAPAAVRVPGLFFNPWSARTLRCDFTLAMKGGIAIEEPIVFGAGANGSNGNMRGRIKNNTPWDFERWWLTNGRGLISYPNPLPKGSSVAIAEGSYGGGSQSEIVTNYLARQRAPHEPPPTALLVNQILNDMLLRPLMDVEAERPDVDLRQMGGGLESYHDWTLAPDRLYFVGVVKESLWPMTGSMKLEKRHGVLIYETALPITQTPADLSAVQWAPVAVEPPQFALLEGGSNFGIRCVPSLVRFMPDRIIPNDITGNLILSIRMSDVNNYNNRNQTFTLPPQSGSSRQYKIVGCPMWVYNQRRREWEETRIHETGTVTLAPARDYLEPGASSLALRMDADPQNLILRDERYDRLGLAPASTAEYTVTGKDIWPPGTNIWCPVNFLRIENVSITFDANGRQPTAAPPDAYLATPGVDPNPFSERPAR